ncbi:MAG: hypothetical protein HYV93_24380 [Candidatus Rokubacteria bacterium]|nr:hypothetical protein [Candidatus Rokubacteria bacterium]
MAPTHAQVFRLGSWGGALEGVTDLRRTDTRTGEQRARAEAFHSEERLNVRNTGAYLYDPRLLTLSLGGSFGYARDTLETDGETASSDGILLGYDASATVLADQPFSLNLFADRSESIVSRELAGQGEGVSERRGGTLFARRVYIPSSLSFRQELQDEESRIAGAVTRRGARRNVLRYEGQRGWEDSETSLLYEFVDESDRFFPALGFRSHEGQVSYGLDFGEELNRHWDSRMRYHTRTGLSESTTWSADESLRVDHTEALRSSYRYFLLRSDTAGGANTTHSAVASLQHRLYESLTTTAAVDGIRQFLPQGEKDSYGGRLSWGYTKRLPLGGRLTAGLGGGLRYEDNRFDAAETAVSQESHTAATPFALPIALANRFVRAASVVVTKTGAGPLPAGCLLPPGPPTALVAGQDYTLRTTNDVTEIVPIPCAGATPGINAGDTVVVDYRFSVPRSLTLTTATLHGNVAVDYRWIRVFASHEQTGQDLIAGQDSRLLDDQRSDTVGAELRYDGGRARASLLGEARRFASTRVNYESVRASGLANIVILPELTLGLSADGTRAVFSDPERETTSQTARATLTYAVGSTLFVDLSGGLRRLEDSAQPTEELIEARLLARWLFRRVEVAPTFEFLDRQRGGTQTREYRALLKTIRRF